MLLDNDAFLIQLNKLFEKTKNVGSIFFTVKKNVQHIKRSERKAIAAGTQPAPPPVPGTALVRAVDGKTKISTIVSQENLFKFHSSYIGLVKLNMTNLKKKDKSKRNRSKKNTSTATAAATTAPTKA